MHGLWSSPLLTKGFVRRGRWRIRSVTEPFTCKVHAHTCLRELLRMLCIVIGSLGRNLVVNGDKNNFNSFKIHRMYSGFSESILTTLHKTAHKYLFNNNNDFDLSFY